MPARTELSAKVLVVDDDDALAEMLTIVLAAEGFETAVCRDGRHVLSTVANFKPDVILLDRMLPGMDGETVCKRLREASQVPIIMLTAMSGSNDIVEGLEAGADDYITKPFRNRELVARVRARLRTSAPANQRIVCGPIVLDTTSHTVTKNGASVSLTPLEFDLLACLISSPNKTFTREELMRTVWGYEHPGDTKLVNVHITRLRHKIEDDAENPTIIRTVRGIGYQAVSKTTSEV